jgi:PhzF family phenazine biosynthesis protein
VRIQAIDERLNRRAIVTGQRVHADFDGCAHLNTVACRADACKTPPSHSETDLRIFQVDAFTATRFTGNPAVVVLDADGHTDATLLAVAREFSHAEVAFVFAANAVDHDVRLRFFNAHKEAPFVGHATVAAHAVLLALGRRGTGVCRQHSGTGIIQVSAHIEPRATGSESVIEFRQTLPELDPPLPFKTTLRVAEALKLPATHLHDVMPARIARKGSSRLLVPVADTRYLENLAPNYDTLISLGSELGTEGFFLFAVNRDSDEIWTESRMFCPALGIPEDPVSGNAHAMLAAYLWDLGQFGKKSATFIGRQGYQMMRPGQVRVRLEIDKGNLIAAHIAGTATLISEGTLAL